MHGLCGRVASALSGALWLAACSAPNPAYFRDARDGGGGGSETARGQAVRLASGGAHTCAQVGDDVYCWGANDHGQLGDGTTVDRSVPGRVAGLPPTSQLAAVSNQTFAITGAGALMAWGANDRGTLGDGTTTYRSSPQAVLGLTSAVTAVWPGFSATCARRATGEVLCWGANDQMQLALPAAPIIAQPTPVPALAGATGVALGVSGGCAVMPGGGVQCWGSNSSGQLADGTTVSGRGSPGPVSGVAGAVAIAGGFTHFCVARGDGHALCWGWNMYGQIGDGTTRDRLVPFVWSAVTDSVAIETGPRQSCALDRSGRVVCAGANRSGQFGSDTTGDVVTPVPSFGADDVTAVSLGDNFGCIVRRGGAVQCAGANDRGQLGDGSLVGRARPAPVQRLP